MVRDDRVDPLPPLAEAVGEKDLPYVDIYPPQQPDGVFLPCLLLPAAEPAVVEGVPQPLGVEELLLPVGKGIVLLLRLGEEEVDFLFRAGIVPHPSLDGETVGVVYLHGPEDTTRSYNSIVRGKGPRVLVFRTLALWETGSGVRVLPARADATARRKHSDPCSP
ncbi:hypothetical protein PAA26_07060 [Methanomassiliicoccaceae archaeon COG_1]|nr:hypothetical protein [Methanomassiliicoccaceae archaeon COG_1]